MLSKAKTNLGFVTRIVMGVRMPWQHWSVTITTRELQKSLYSYLSLAVWTVPPAVWTVPPGPLSPLLCDRPLDQTLVESHFILLPFTVSQLWQVVIRFCTNFGAWLFLKTLKPLLHASMQLLHPSSCSSKQLVENFRQPWKTCIWVQKAVTIFAYVYRHKFRTCSDQWQSQIQLNIIEPYYTSRYQQIELMHVPMLQGQVLLDICSCKVPLSFSMFEWAAWMPCGNRVAAVEASKIAASLKQFRFW